MKIKKITLLLTILCASALNGMEPTSLSELRRQGKEITYKETYAPLLPELKQHILNIALAKSNDLLDAIKTIKAFSILHGVNYNLLAKSDTLKKMLINKFPTTVKNVIIFALKKPEKYLPVATLLKENFESGLDTIMQENLLQKNLEEFTVLIHMIYDQEKNNLQKNNKKIENTTAKLATSFGTQLAKNYNALGLELLRASNSKKVAKLIQNGADTNYSNTFINSYHTPLSMAAVSGQVDIVTLLLNAGANPYIEIPDTGTALDIVLQAIEEQKLPNYFDPVYSEQLEAIKTLLEQAMQQ